MDMFQAAGIDRLSEFLDFAARRQEVINSNLANLETPGYQARDLSFEEYFRSRMELDGDMRTTRPGHFTGKPVLLREDSPEVVEVPSEALGNDLNNVDLDREMTHLAENVLKFSAVARIAEMKLQMIRAAIERA